MRTAILKAQIEQLEDFLGFELYHAFMEDFKKGLTEQRFIDLYNGLTYQYGGENRYFRGIKRLLSTYAYANIVADNQLRVSRSGNREKEAENSVPSANDSVNQHVRNIESFAQTLEDNASTYLNENNSLYSEWDGSIKTTTGFKVYRA